MPNDPQPVRASNRATPPWGMRATHKSLLFRGGSQNGMPLAPRSQTFAEIVEIIKSYPKPKGIILEIDAGFWGEDFAASSDKASYTGEVDRWQNNKEETLMVK